MQQVFADLQQCLAIIGGNWCEAASGRRLEVIDPATGVIIGRVPEMGAVDAEHAIEAAGTALPGWRQQTAKARGQALRRWFDAVTAAAEELASIITAESGKPLAEARGEVGYAATFLEWYAEEARRAYGEVIPPPQTDKRLLVIRQPIGVAAAITPWNFPAAMILRKAAAALAAGCTMVIKPAPQTPLTALALASLAEQSGLPPGVLNVVTGSIDSSREIGTAICESPTVRALSFTGSTAAGVALARQAAGTVKKVSLELGGNASFIVFDDADLDAAVAGAMAAKFRNTGQTCVCANRLFVQAGVHDSFVEKLAAATANLKVGPGVDEGVAVGPLIDSRAVDKVTGLVADATAAGGQTVLGGGPHPLGGTFFEPTVISGATPAMRLAREEIFGPVAAIFRFETEAEVLELANATEFGLASYFYSRDVGRCFRVAEALECGMVGINTGLISTEVAPFGGIKSSGLGREGGRYGLDEYQELKYLCFGAVS
jgi:succinate-semialdehyde dehydrogenase/glutarate-semialdehyde dehydrogenase